MAFSKIVLTFTRQIQVDEAISFVITDVDTAGVVVATEICKNPRLGLGQFNFNTLPTYALSMANWLSAFNVDYNIYYQYSTASGTDGGGNGTITITAKKNNINFSAFSSNAGVTAVITNEPYVIPFAITSIVYSPATVNDVCTHVKVLVTAGDVITDVVTPVVITGNVDNDVEFEILRGINNPLEINNGVITLTDALRVIPLNTAPTVNTITTPGGTSATVLGNVSLNLTYSLDNITYQSSNVFPGLLAGNFTAYAKDQYGCVKSTAFVIDAFTPNISVVDPVAYISNTNSIRYKISEVWDDITIYKNDANTLSGEENTQLVKPYVQKFISNDSPTTQVKHNFDTIAVKTIDSDGNEVVVPTTKMTTNIDKKDMRDAMPIEIEAGIYGFYFTSGNTYDYDTEIANGTFELFGGLPEWAEIGNYFKIGLAYFQIVAIEYNDTVNAEVIQVAEYFDVSSGVAKAGALYNVFEWDAYEFAISMSAYIGKYFQVQIDLTDADFNAVTFLSEEIFVSLTLPRMLELKASNTANNEILYSTGIEHILRVEYDLFGLASETEIEIHKTDNNVYKLSANVYAKKVIEFSPLPTMMIRKLQQILTLNELLINGSYYTVESVDEPTRIGVTNQYRLSAKVFESKAGIENELSTKQLNLETIEIPALVDGGNGLIEL